MEGENGLENVKNMVRRQCLAAGGGEVICGSAVKIVENAVLDKHIEKTASNGRTRIAVKWTGNYDFAALTVAERDDGKKVAVLGLGGGGLPPLVVVILDNGAIEEVQVFAKEYFVAMDPHPNALIKLIRNGVPPGFGE
jgi:hypothetical protein